MVRGHHANQLWQMHYIGFTPDYLTKAAEEAADNPITRFLIDKGYYADIYGCSEEEASAARQGIHSFLEGFTHLEPDTPVVFTATQKDGICASCTIGAHCDKPENAKGDSNWINALARTAAALGLEAQISLETAESIGRFGRKAEKPVKLTVAADVARLLLSDRSLPIRSANNPYMRFIMKTIVAAGESRYREVKAAEAKKPAAPEVAPSQQKTVHQEHSLQVLVTELAELCYKDIPATVEGVESQIASINRACEIILERTDGTGQFSETIVEILQQAAAKLRQAAEVLAGDDESAQKSISTYIGAISGIT